jgi:hypothetical protein
MHKLINFVQRRVVKQAIITLNLIVRVILLIFKICIIKLGQLILHFLVLIAIFVIVVLSIFVVIVVKAFS